MKKTKHFNISVPELGDAPDITQVSNAISDLEDATAGTLEIMKAEMQGTKITLTSVSRKTKRTGYYEGMSIRFKSPQDIEPNYLKTISVDGLGDQTLSVEYKVNRNEYIDIVYEGNKFTAYPVVVQKTDSVSNNSSVLVGTAKGVKTAYDKGVEALNKADQAQSSADKAQSTADGKVSKNGDTMNGALKIDTEYQPTLNFKINGINKGGIYGDTNSLSICNPIASTFIHMYDNGNTTIHAKNLNTSSKEVIGAINELNSGKENKIEKKTGFNLDKSDSVASNSSNTIATSLAVKTAYDKAGHAQSTADGKVSKNGDTMTGGLRTIDVEYPLIANYTSSNLSGGFARGYEIRIDNATKSEFGVFGRNGKEEYTYLGSDYADPALRLYHDGTLYLRAKNLKTNHKEVVGAINEVNNKVDTKLSKNDFAGNPILWSGASYNVTAALPGDVQSLDDVLYLQVFGGNDCGTIDGKFLSELSDGTRVRLGYVQGSGTDMSMWVVKVNGRTFKFDQQGTTCTDCADQTFPINYVVVRRIK